MRIRQTFPMLAVQIAVTLLLLACHTERGLAPGWCEQQYPDLTYCADYCAKDCAERGDGTCHPDVDGDFCAMVRADVAAMEMDGGTGRDAALPADGGDGGELDAGDAESDGSPVGDGGSDADAAGSGCVANEDCPSASASSCGSSGACEECAAASDCAHLGLGACEQGECLACTSTDGCGDSAPVCDESGSEPVCVACTADDDSQCTGLGQVCDVATNRCEECVADADCTGAAAARCDLGTNTCTTCTDSSQCDGITGTEQCNVDSGQCVECTQDSQCGDDHTCTDTGACVDGLPGSVSDCGSCFDDRQCADGRSCIVLSGQSGDLPEGECLPLQDVDICTTRAYLREVSEDDVRGGEQEACRPSVATCEEVTRFDTSCDGSEVDDLCMSVGPGSIWTIGCGLAFDCPNDTLVCTDSKCVLP